MAVVVALSLGGGAARAADWQREAACIATSNVYTGEQYPLFTNGCNFAVTVYYAAEDSESPSDVTSIDIPAHETRTPSISAEVRQHLMFVACRLHERAFIGRAGIAAWYPHHEVQCRADS
jgi:hypothetical protein